MGGIVGAGMWVGGTVGGRLWVDVNVGGDCGWGTVGERLWMGGMVVPFSHIGNVQVITSYS